MFNDSGGRGLNNYVSEDCLEELLAYSSKDLFTIP